MSINVLIDEQPGESCPAIDAIQKDLDGLRDELTTILPESEMTMFKSYYDDVVANLEIVRRINSDLRIWGMNCCREIRDTLEKYAPDELQGDFYDEED